MPCRAALYAVTYKEASQVNFEKTGKKLSREMWNIMPKMRQLNDFLVNNTEALAVIKETHPELCFTGLSAGRPMEYAKKKEKDPAFEERLRVLISYCSGANALIEKALKEYQRRYVARDDIVDAIGLNPYDWTGRVRRVWQDGNRFLWMTIISSNSFGGT